MYAMFNPQDIKARWPSGLRRSIKEDILSIQKNLLSSGVGSNPTLVTNLFFFHLKWKMYSKLGNIEGHFVTIFKCLSIPL